MAKSGHEWDLSPVYTSLADEDLERDVRSIERAYAAFAKRYSKSDTWLTNPKKLRTAIEEFEKLFELPKPLTYLFLLKSIHTDDKQIDARIAQIHARIVRAVNSVVFFQNKLARITKSAQRTLLASKELSEYTYFLKRVFARSAHHLSEKEETLLNSLDLPREEMWVDLTERLLGKSEVEHDGSKIPLSEAMNNISTLSTNKRRALHKKVMETFREHADVAEAELNALYTSKSVIDSRRGFKDPVDETLLSFENTQKELDALRAAVRDKRELSHDFFALKKRLLGLSKLTYADRNADIGSIERTFTFEKSLELLQDIFGNTHPQFQEILDDMAENRRIDVFPRRHKSSGAFCLGDVAFPTFVLLNHVSTFDSLTTFAHEMGHAIHTELAKRERPLYQGYSTAVAEFASTFFEDMVFDAVRPTLSKQEQKVMLHNRINRDISTIFRQLAFFEFEYALHQEVRTHGYVSKERIAELLNYHTKQYMGDTVDLDERDGYFFVTLSHIRRHFYVYSYAYGALLSRIASHRSKEDQDLFGRIVELLSSGASDSPKQLFKKIGIHTEKQETYTEGLNMISQDITTLKSL